MAAKNKKKRAKRPVGRPRSSIEKVSVLVYLPRPVDRLLKDWSVELKISKSAIVERALTRYGPRLIRSATEGS